MLNVAKSWRARQFKCTMLDSLQLAPSFQGPAEGQFIRKFQSASSRQPVGDARHLHAPGAEPFGQVKTRRIAFHVRGQSENDFLDWLRADALLQLRNTQILDRKSTRLN